MKHIVALSVIFFATPSIVTSETGGGGKDRAEEHPTKELHRGIIPLKDYSGDFQTRSNLLGDWGGIRSELSQKGISFKGSLTPLLQGVAEGGATTDTKISAAGDLWGTVDFDRMGVIPGGLLTMRVESNVGASTVTTAGTIMAPSYNSILPVSLGQDDDYIAITNFYYTQFLGEKFGVWAGRSDTHHNANLGEFAGLSSEVGNTQFMNFALTGIPGVALAQPYVTSLGAGAFVRPTRDLAFAAMVMDSRESSQIIGLNDFGKDWNAFATVAYQHRLAGLPGGQVVGFSYSWDGNYTVLDESQLPNIAQGGPVDSQKETWAATYSGWQYIQVLEGDTSQFVNTGDGRADHRGWGIFLLAGLAEKNINPVRWSVAGGIGGRGIWSSRPQDQFGIGYFYLDLHSGAIADAIGIENNEQGIELYYEAEIVPWFHLTPDLQVIDPGLRASDTAVILGLRGNATF